MLKKLVFSLIAAIVSISAVSQAVPSGSSASKLEVGGSYLFGFPDYSPQKAYGFGVFVDYDFTRHYGLTFDYHRADIFQHTDNETSYEFGARYRQTYGRFSPYIRGFVGRGIYEFGALDHSDSTEGFNAAQGGNTNGYMLYGFAGGLDVNLTDHFSLRAEGDYQSWLAGTNLENGLKPVLSTIGIAYSFGGDSTRSYPPDMGCRATPSYVFPGDIIKVDSNMINLRSLSGLTYAWSTSGGSVGPKRDGSDVEIRTDSLAPGEYIVKGRLLKQRGKREIAFCEAPFTVREFEPPTVACSANPSTATPGTDIAISTTGGSPQNRPMMYSYSTTAGVIKPAGSTAVLSTNGLSLGPVTVKCNVTDDLGHSASSATTVMIASLPNLVPAIAVPLCSVSFQRDHMRPVRVDNEAKACLDDVALKMHASAGSRLILVGNYAPSETSLRAEERAINVKKYLVGEQNIDASRIEVRIGSDWSRTLNDILIPVGATFNDSGTHPFNEKSVMRPGETYGKH